MLCHFRTLGAVIGVAGVCFMIATFSWQHVLVGFALAGITWALWSWSAQLNEDKTRVQNIEAFERKRRRGSADVYAFPGSNWGNEAHS